MKSHNDLGENTNVLYKERESFKLVKLIEERINQLANTPGIQSNLKKQKLKWKARQNKKLK